MIYHSTVFYAVYRIILKYFLLDTPHNQSCLTCLVQIFQANWPYCQHLKLIQSFLICLISMTDFDMDENLIHTIDSKYYEIPEFSKLNHAVKDGFSLFHLNIRSLSAHLTELSQLLSCFNFV